MRLYLDTSVFGGYFDEEFAMSTKKLFDEIFRRKHKLIVSAIVEEEIELAPKRIKELFSKIPKSTIIKTYQDSESKFLADEYIKQEVVSKKYFFDAFHIAIATVNRVDFIVSWNFKHMVNINRIRKYNSVNLRLGYPVIDIRTPSEIIDENKEI